jgi:hypothetical protein
MRPPAATLQGRRSFNRRFPNLPYPQANLQTSLKKKKGRSGSRSQSLPHQQASGKGKVLEGLSIHPRGVPALLDLGPAGSLPAHIADEINTQNLACHALAAASLN